MKKITIGGLVVLSVVGAAATTLYAKASGNEQKPSATPSKPSAGTASSAAPGPAIAALRSELRRDRAVKSAELSSLRAELSGLEQRVDAMASEPAGVAPIDAAATLDDQRRRERAHVAAMQQSFADAFDAEPIDLEWSNAQVPVIETAFAAQASAHTLHKLECRSTLCRLVVSHRSPDAVHQLADLLSAGELTGGNFFHPGDREGTSVAYVFRPGQTEALQRIFEDARLALGEQ